MVQPGDEGYDALHAHWEAHGWPGQMENLAEGWLMRAYVPEPGHGPVFVTECSAAGYAVAVGTQLSWRRRKALPVEE